MNMALATEDWQPHCNSDHIYTIEHHIYSTHLVPIYNSEGDSSCYQFTFLITTTSNIFKYTLMHHHHYTKQHQKLIFYKIPDPADDP